MFIPYAVDVPPNHRPVMNWLLVSSVIVAFFFQIQASDSAVRSFVLDGWNIKGLFGHMWLHIGFFHIFGNMIFLWLFGNAVCSKLGNLFYFPIYIGLGLIASASHLVFDGRLAVGASGAISGIVGMYLVFFPQNVVSCFFWLIFLFTFRPVVFDISGIWMILLWFIFNIYGLVWGSQSVAYIAHIGGFLGGFVLASLLLKMKLIKMERDEKSIYELILRKRKKDSKIPKEEIEYWQREFNKPKSEKPKAFSSSLKSEKAKSEISTQEHIETRKEFLRFNCQCGQRIKVPREYAGKNGRCPKCSMRLKIPEI